ncbi:MAG: Asp-tRNA(Asn)/Glu-tRNA(Gln) amidotransferase subunit GatB [Sediminibacterium sp.]|nr:Asp-tRNA(Asn)/Glu-tRNA(Gln) amidotransferase subunit GatB [Sediminibacterium sp.]
MTPVELEAVIGLEIHVQLASEQKLFCSDLNNFEGNPNTRVSPLTLGHPGTLPFMNKNAIELALRFGITCNSEISPQIQFDRKNYMYPDLPKGYQISQYYKPICRGGNIKIDYKNQPLEVMLHQIHIEEDAGKNNHELFENYSAIDLNRAGTPLIEIVTKPCIPNPEIAFLVVQQVRKMVKWLNVSKGNMEEGCLRCDANVSVRVKGQQALGTKIEIKNINSLRNIKKALEVEIERLSAKFLAGQEIFQETRGFNAQNDTTYLLREKENIQDYRYFNDPDLPPILVNEEFLAHIKKQLPKLPEDFKNEWNNFGLSDYHCQQLSEEYNLAQLFNNLIDNNTSEFIKTAANIFLGPWKEFENKQEMNYGQAQQQLHLLKILVGLVLEQKIHISQISEDFIKAVIYKEQNPMEYAQNKQLFKVQDHDLLQEWCQQVLQNNPQKLAEYRKGKKALLGFFIGELKRISKGQADPQKGSVIFEQLINN